MNAIVPSGELIPHRFTVADVRAMVKAGVVEEGARVELINGELVEMPADGPLHNRWSNALGFWLFGSLDPELYAVVPGSTLVLSDTLSLKPDYYVFPAWIDDQDLRASDVLLAIEEADTSLRRDLGWKAGLYASHGVRDYWVVDLNAQRTHVHREPGPDGYGSVEVFERDQAVAALLIPGLSLRLADLPRVD